MTRQMDLRRLRAMTRERILALTIMSLDLPRTVKERISAFLAKESEGKISPMEITISDLLCSHYDLIEMRSMADPKNRMFDTSVRLKIIQTLKDRYHINYIQERKDYHARRISELPIASVKSLAPTYRSRLSEFLSDASFGKIQPEKATITDLLHSAYDICDMPAYYDGYRRKMFTPMTSERIVIAIEQAYGIDYAKEREAFLAEHTGVDSFICRTRLPNSMHKILLRKMGNYNATFRDLLNVPFDFRNIEGFGGATEKFILGKFKAAGIDYETARRQDQI